jgi:hypothetical protein
MGIQRRRGNGFLARFVQVRIQLLSFFSDRRIDTTTVFLWSSNIVSLSSVNMKYNVNTVIKNSKSSLPPTLFKAGEDTKRPPPSGSPAKPSPQDSTVISSRSVPVGATQQRTLGAHGVPATPACIPACHGKHSWSAQAGVPVHGLIPVANQ